MAHRVMLIGSAVGSKAGSKPSNAKDSSAARPVQSSSNRYKQPKSASKPREMVEVYVLDEYVSTIPLRLLLRFSSHAASTFTRWNAEEDSSKTQQSSDETTSSTEAVTRITSDYPSYFHAGNMRYQVRTETVAYPSAASVRRCLGWMRSNQKKSGGDKLTEFLFPDPLTVQIVVDIHLASNCLKLRSFPAEIPWTVMDVISKSPPTAGDLKFVYDHVSRGDAVITRTVTSIVEWNEKKAYSAEEHNAIWRLVHSDGYLTNRFRAIEGKRGAAARVKQGAEDFASQEAYRFAQDVEDSSNNANLPVVKTADPCKRAGTTNMQALESRQAHKMAEQDAANSEVDKVEVHGSRQAQKGSRRKGRGARKGLNPEGKQVPGAYY